MADEAVDAEDEDFFHEGMLEVAMRVRDRAA
jgi:hypothetical protein